LLTLQRRWCQTHCRTMVSPDKVMFSSKTMRVSPSPDRPSSKYQSHTVHDDDKKHEVCCLDEDLTSTKFTTSPLQQGSTPLHWSSLTSSCVDVETTQNTERPNNKRGKLESDYMCLMLLQTVMTQDSSVTVILKEQGTKTSKKDLFKEIDKS
jgi:hypothetical protein